MSVDHLDAMETIFAEHVRKLEQSCQTIRTLMQEIRNIRDHVLASRYRY